MVRLLHGVELLPQEYEVFLRVMGVDQGQLFSDSGLRIRELPDALRVADSLCEEAGAQLPQDSLVIGSREGYQFLVIAAVTGEVFCWTEWDNEQGYLIVRVADSIRSFVREEFARFMAGHT